MSNGIKLMYQVFATFLFCIAISLLLLGIHNFMSVVNISNEVAKDKIIFEQNHDIEEPSATKGEILAMLFTPLEYDIEINGVFISKYDNIKNNLNTYPILEGKYRKSYIYNDDGNILKIIYTRIGTASLNAIKEIYNGCFW